MNKSYKELEDFLDTHYMSREELLMLFFSITRNKRDELLPLFYKYRFVWNEIYTYLVETKNFEMFKSFMNETDFNSKFQLSDMMKSILKDIPVLINDKELNNTDLLGLNALHLAVWKNDKSLIDLLIRSGIDKNHMDKYGRIPFDYSI